MWPGGAQSPAPLQGQAVPPHTHHHHPPPPQTLLCACCMGFSLPAEHQNSAGAGELWPGLRAWTSHSSLGPAGPVGYSGISTSLSSHCETLCSSPGRRGTVMQADMVTLVPEDAVAPLGCAWGGGGLSLQPLASTEPADSPCPRVSWSLPTCLCRQQSPWAGSARPYLFPAHLCLLPAAHACSLPVAAAPCLSLAIPARCCLLAASCACSLPIPTCLPLPITACSLLIIAHPCLLPPHRCLFPAHPCLLLAHCCPARPCLLPTR